jgi:uncharacterized DUF497 family protein
MKFEWDENKNEANIRERGLDFADACEMFKSPMLVKPDSRKDYGEVRYIGFGYVQRRLMAVVFTKQVPGIIRIISFRKANKREQARFEKAITNRLGAH